MLNDVLPTGIREIIISKISQEMINEIRIRKNKPVVVFIKCVPYYICGDGLTTILSKAFIATKEMVEDVVFRASDCSLFSINEQIKKGYISLNNGIRIGVCGTLVYENDIVKTMINFSSVNIRLPHNIKNFSCKIFDDIVGKNYINNTLIISPPGAGKTTFLRDFVYQLSQNNYCLNVCIVDERGEIAGDGISDELGNFCDILSNCSKQTAFTALIRSMNPDLIVTDEIAGVVDAQSLVEAGNCGINVLATIHAESIEQLKAKEIFNILPKNFFKRYVVLSKNQGAGTFEGVFDQNFNRIAKW